MTTKPNEPDGLQERVARELCRQAGYDPDGAARNGWGWRNYMDGAAQIVAIFPAQPVADAGGVAQAVAFAHETMALSDDGTDANLHRAHTHAAWVIGLSKRLQSVAAATAAKDAEIAALKHDIERHITAASDLAGEVARLREALTGVRSWAASLTVTDMNEIVADGGITAGMVVGQEAIEQVRRLDAALSEAREAGAKD